MDLPFINSDRHKSSQSERQMGNSKRKKSNNPQDKGPHVCENKSSVLTAKDVATSRIKYDTPQYVFMHLLEPSSKWDDP